MARASKKKRKQTWFSGNAAVVRKFSYSDHEMIHPRAHTAIENANGAVYELFLLRYNKVRTRIVVNMGGASTGKFSESKCLDLDTGEDIIITSESEGVEAQKLKVKDLPADIKARWPQDAQGKLKPAGWGGGVTPADFVGVAKNTQKQEVAS